ncbi:MAG: hypothetical protein SNG49_02335 [Rikenellaceae bacterium]
MTQKEAIQTSTIPMPTTIVESLELLAQINKNMQAYEKSVEQNFLCCVQDPINKIDNELSVVALELAEIVKQEAANNQYFYVTE